MRGPVEAARGRQALVDRDALADAVGERGQRDRADRLDPVVVDLDRERQADRARSRPARARPGPRPRSPRRGPRPSAIVPGMLYTLASAPVASAGGDQHAGRVLGVLEQRRAAEAHRVRPAEHRGDDRLGRAAGHALVAPDAVDGHRAQPDARDAVLEPVDPGVALVGLLVHAVVVVRVGAGVRRRAGPVAGSASSAAYIPIELVYTTGAIPAPRRLTASNTFTVPTTLTIAPQRRVGAAERDLQGGEVDDVGDVLARRASALTARRSVMSPWTTSTAASSSGGHDLGQAARVGAEVERT